MRAAGSSSSSPTRIAFSSGAGAVARERCAAARPVIREITSRALKGLTT